MSPATKMLSVTTPLMSKARQPASQATPQNPVGQVGALEPFDVADGAQRRHHHVDVERGPVRQLSLPDVPVGVAFERFDRDAGAQVDPGVALHLGGDVADHPAERPDQRCAGALGDRHVQAEITADRGHLGADEAGADDQHPLRPRLERRLQLGGVIAGAQREHALELAPLRG